MSRIGYVKYNRTRVPEFQTKTQIVFDENEKKVVKSPLYDEGKEYIQLFEKHCKMLKALYKNVEPIDVECQQGEAVFSYVEGITVAEYIEQQFESNEDILKIIKKYLDKLLCYNTSEIIDFQLTDAFEKVFGKYNGKVKAVKCANVDEIFDNFIIQGDKFYIIDYEWVFEFPIPIDFMRFRTVYYFYAKNGTYFADKITMDEYLEYFGFDKENINIWLMLDDHFQQYVHGSNRKYIYTTNYLKETHNINRFLNENKDIENTVNQLHQTLSEKEQLILLKDTNIDDLRSNEQLLNNIIDDLRSNEQLLSDIIDDYKKNEACLNQNIRELSEAIEHKDNYILLLRRCMRNPFFALVQVIKKLAKKILPEIVQIGLYCLFTEGLEVFLYKLKNYKNNKDQYEQWLEQNEKDIMYVETLAYNPVISVVVPVYNVASNQLIECIESVRNQTYKNWELCLVDDYSTMDSVRETLKQYEGIDNIKIVYRTENGHISKATNSGIEIASGEFIALLDCDDLLAKNALYEMAKKLNEDNEYDFIYSDEDKITEDGKIRKDPFFKPDWSPDTFMSIMYTCHFSMFRKTLVDELGGMRVGLEGSQDYDLVLRVMEKTNKIGHVPHILYHWRERKESTANSMTAKPYIIESTKKAKLDALQRRGLQGHLECIEPIMQFRVVYEPQNNPMVSIIIPSKDNPQILRQCLETIRKNTTYSNYEIIVIDNGSNQTNKKIYTDMCNEFSCVYEYEKMDFNFSKMCNMGAAKAKGDYYLFLNDDIEIKGENWLSILLGQAQVPYVGAVGCKLLYPNSNLIQHAGVLNLEIGPGHAFHRFDDNMNYYYGRNILDYNFSIVTGACLMLSKDKFKEINGFEESLPVAYNDVDLCFKLLEYGYYNVLRNDVCLVHHESISRGYDDITPEKAERQKQEMQHLYEMHPKYKGYDPCYNPNLVKTRGDFSFDLSNAYEIREFELEKREIHLSEDLEYHIDEISVTNTIKIVGWVFDKKKKKVGNVKIVLVDKKNNQYVLLTDKIYRPDVRETYAITKISFAGFQGEGALDEIDEGIYDIYLKISEKYIKIRSDFSI